MSNEGRSHNISIEIKATPEEVWRQITEAEGIQRWLAPIAAVIPGLGGKLMLSWGPGMEGEGPITSWEPNHKFGWTERAETDAPRIVEFTIEARDGGTTLLTLVHSGFSSDASFDTEYESTSGGWRSMLAALKYDLERFAGQPARHELRMQMLDRAAAGVL